MADVHVVCMYGISIQGQEIIKSETNEQEIIKLTPNQGPTPTHVYLVFFLHSFLMVILWLLLLQMLL